MRIEMNKEDIDFCVMMGGGLLMSLIFVGVVYLLCFIYEDVTSDEDTNKNEMCLSKDYVMTFYWDINTSNKLEPEYPKEICRTNVTIQAYTSDSINYTIYKVVELLNADLICEKYLYMGVQCSNHVKDGSQTIKYNLSLYKGEEELFEKVDEEEYSRIKECLKYIIYRG